jgi:hypothetical protein
MTRNRIARAQEIIDEIHSGREAPEPTERELKRDDAREKR